MIKIDSIHIEDFRGIRDLRLDFRKKNFAVSGPNGSGKSGIVDAIEFGLTGNISRLKGKGTAEIKLSEHGPHVDKRDYPDAAKVTLTVYFPKLNKTAVLVRKIKAPRKPVISPNDDDIISVLEEVELYPEIALTRREIIKFILAEASKRSSEVQTLLRLEDVTNVRSALNSCVNRLTQNQKNKSTLVATTADSLRRHMDIQKLSQQGILDVVNKKRTILGAKTIYNLTANSELNEGVSALLQRKAESINKESALKDLEELVNKIELETNAVFIKAKQEIVNIKKSLDEDSGLLKLIKYSHLIELGSELVIESECPLCDTFWEVDELKQHLTEKLKKSQVALSYKNNIIQHSAAIAETIHDLIHTLDSVIKFQKSLNRGTVKGAIDKWKDILSEQLPSFKNFEEIILNDSLFHFLTNRPDDIFNEITDLKETISKIPDQSITDEAKTFLTIAQERFKAYQDAKRVEHQANVSLKKAKLVYNFYCKEAENRLQALYDEVEGDFSSFYQQINRDDEGEFVAKLEPSQGKLGLKVDFYKKGMFPPSAYHSEGHQDGMGVCLYLALMKKVLDNDFSLCILDDVVMSVDHRHRKQFCLLLKSEFPDTQFIITTHEKVWAQQMRTAGLVTSGTSIEFHSWSVDTGPVVASSEIWDKIQNDIDQNDIPSASQKLRRHIEFVLREIASNIKASVPFKADGNWDLGDLFPNVISQQGKLLKKAAESADSWGNVDDIEKITNIKNARREALTKHGEENWIVNKAVHFNEWATFGKEDFEPVVQAFKEILQSFQCENPNCNSLIYVEGGLNMNSLRCSCGRMNLNLVKKKS